MKRFYVILLCCTPAAAQPVLHRFPNPGRIDWENYNTSYSNTPTAGPYLVTAVPTNGKYLEVDHSSDLALAEDIIDGNIRELNAYDSSAVYFYAPGVTPDNADRYEYRIQLDSGTEVVPWTAFQAFTDSAAPNSSGFRCGLLGGFSAPWDHYITAQIREKGSEQVLSTSVVYWQQVRPALLNIYMPDELGEFMDMNDFLRQVSHNYSMAMEMTAKERERWRKHYDPDELDSATGLPLHLWLNHDENNLIFYLNDHIYSRKALEYHLVRDGREVMAWRPNDFDLNFIWLRDLSPGEYVLGMRFSAQRQNLSTYGFTIKRAWTQTWWFRVGAVLVLCLLLGLAWLLIRLRQKAVTDRYKREGLSLELKSIRSQLNPHFIFNALSSIQGLINKNDLPNANRYLSEFGSLMRNTLQGSRKDFTPLDTEIQVLNTYLRLEQLRFPFTYRIQVDPALPTGDLEVPSLLLQPLVENAVKHGISALQGEGLIEIGFQRESANFTCTIRDNGPGFDPAAMDGGGYGLSLTRDRIRLLNEVSPDQAIRMDVRSGEGTTLVLTFENWIQ